MGPGRSPGRWCHLHTGPRPVPGGHGPQGLQSWAAGCWEGVVKARARPSPDSPARGRVRPSPTALHREAPPCHLQTRRGSQSSWSGCPGRRAVTAAADALLTCVALKLLHNLLGLQVPNVDQVVLRARHDPLDAAEGRGAGREPGQGTRAAGLRSVPTAPAGRAVPGLVPSRRHPTACRSPWGGLRDAGRQSRPSCSSQGSCLSLRVGRVPLGPRTSLSEQPAAGALTLATPRAPARPGLRGRGWPAPHLPAGDGEVGEYAVLLVLVARVRLQALKRPGPPLSHGCPASQVTPQP